MSNCDVVFQMGSFNSWCKTHESKADTERQCCMTGLAERAEAAEARAAELAAQLATARAALERVTIERDEAQEHLVYLFDHLKVWLGARLIGEVEP